MQQQFQEQTDFLPPPPYDSQGNEIYLSEMDSTAWPSSYYGKTRRIDLAKFYFDILKASGDEMIKDHQRQQQCDDVDSTNAYSSSSSDDEEQFFIAQKPKSAKKVVTFSEAPPTIYEYEPEYENSAPTHYTSRTNMTYSHAPTSYKNSSLFDEGWPGRTKKAMSSAGFMDFKSKIEAKLGAVNDPSLMLALDQNSESMLNLAETDQESNDDSEHNKTSDNTNNSNSLFSKDMSSYDNRGYYRHRKSPLVQSLNLQPVLNQHCDASFTITTKFSPSDNENDDPGLLTDNTPSPSNSCTDSPITPKDNSQDLLLVPNVTVIPQPDITSTTKTTIGESATSTTGTSLLSRKNSGKWLRSLSMRMRNGSTNKLTKIKA